MTETINTTKDGIKVRVGQVWRDNDKRMLDRHVRVVAVDGGKATVARTNKTNGWTSDRTTKLSIRRMHNTSTGWTLVSEKDEV